MEGTSTYYLANRERLMEYGRRYYWAHRESILEKKKGYYAQRVRRERLKLRQS